MSSFARKMPSGPPQRQNFIDTMAAAYMISVASAWIAEGVTYPLDLVKTRLQIQGEKSIQTSKVSPRGAVSIALGVVREEGVFRLWQGIQAALLRHFIYSGTRLVVYREMRNRMSAGNVGDFPMWKSATCGVTAGVLGQFFANPADLLKVQMQVEGRRRMMGLPARIDGMLDAFQKIVQQAGVRGLWQGTVPNCQRAALVTLGDLSAYDVSKRVILEKTDLPDSHLVHVMASSVSGFCAAVLGTPADVLKTRIMNQPLDEHGRGQLYTSTFDCVSKTVKNEGLTALYKGFVPIWLRMAPWSLTFWVSYEYILYGLGGNQF